MKHLLIASVFLFSNVLWGEIKTIHQLNEVEKELTEPLTSEDLILFDIDYTLTLPDHPALSKGVIKKNKVLYQQKMAALSEEEKQLLPAILITYTANKLTEENASELVQKLRKRGAAVIGFTAADTAIIPGIGDFPSWRLKELERLGIQFSDIFNRTEFVEFSPFRGTHPLYDKGILYSNVTTPKGFVLKSFIEKLPQRPSRILFVDDMLENLISADKAMEEVGIPFLGLHYTPPIETEDLAPEVFENVWQELIFRLRIKGCPLTSRAAIDGATKR